MYIHIHIYIILIKLCKYMCMLMFRASCLLHENYDRILIKLFLIKQGIRVEKLE